MQITSFQALCLLPNTDDFPGYLLKRTQRLPQLIRTRNDYEIVDGDIVYLPKPTRFSLEHVNNLATRQDVVLFGKCAGRRLGFLIFFGSGTWVKADRQKAEAFLRECAEKPAEYVFGDAV